MNDLISRQAAIDALGMMLPVKWFDKAETALYKLPSTQKHGKWKSAIVARNIDALECSECGAKYPNLLWMPGYSYCPNCGALMEDVNRE